MAGGGAGALGRFVLDPGTGEERVLASAVADQALPRGSVLRISTPGGGGYGAPAERDADALARDLREERISPEDARRTYGWSGEP